MFRRFVSIGALAVGMGLLFAACAGPQGTAEPAKPTGPAGSPGGIVTVGATYVGSAACSKCHLEIYETFMKSGHPWKLTPVVNGRPPAYPFTQLENPPAGYTWNDISYVIGGYNWEARFMDKRGYIITGRPGASAGDAGYLNQYNYANAAVGRDAAWVTYKSGQPQLQYDCGACHTTGYSVWPPDSHQDNMPGAVGTWAEPGIQCERCHGPGGDHVGDPRAAPLAVNASSELCGECHIRGTAESVNAANGFIEHHEQYEEIFQGKHASLDCVVCHEPHAGVVQLRLAQKLDPSVRTTRMQCADCHFFKEAQYQKVAAHQATLQCLDCHMPRLIETAWGNAATFTGDIRTHLIAIDPAQVNQFSEDGRASLPKIGLDFACRHCHVPGGPLAKTDEQLIEAATGYHQAP